MALLVIWREFIFLPVKFSLQEIVFSCQENPAGIVSQDEKEFAIAIRYDRHRASTLRRRPAHQGIAAAEKTRARAACRPYQALHRDAVEDRARPDVSNLANADSDRHGFWGRA